MAIIKTPEVIHKPKIPATGEKRKEMLLDEKHHAIWLSCEELGDAIRLAGDPKDESGYSKNPNIMRLIQLADEAIFRCQTMTAQIEEARKVVPPAPISVAEEQVVRTIPALPHEAISEFAEGIGKAVKGITKRLKERK